MEKKITVPPCAVARTAPPSQPGTSTHTTVTWAGPPAARTVSATAAGSRASAITTWSARPDLVSRSASAWVGTSPITARAPASRAAAADSAAALARRAEDGHHRRRCRPASGLPHHPGGQRRCPAHVHHRERERDRHVAGEHRGDRAAEQDRMAVTRDLLTAAVPAGQPVGDGQRGEAERHQRGDPVAGGQPQRRLWPGLCHDAGEHPARAGHRVLHLAPLGDDAEHRGAHRGGVPAGRACPSVPAAASLSWRNDAASRFSLSTRTRTSSGHSPGLGSSRQAAWGSAPAGSMTRCSPSGEPGKSSRCILFSH